MCEVVWGDDGIYGDFFFEIGWLDVIGGVCLEGVNEVWYIFRLYGESSCLLVSATTQE